MTDILEQAREIVAKATHCDDVLRCNSVEFPCPCRDAASAILALAEPKWREINDEAKSGERVLVAYPYFNDLPSRRKRNRDERR
jgi:hypothetical protein